MLRVTIFDVYVNFEVMSAIHTKMLLLRNNRLAPPLIKQVITKTLPVTANCPQHFSFFTPMSSQTKVRLAALPRLSLSCRHKSKKKKEQSEAKVESETDEEEEADDAWDKAITDKNSKLLNVNVGSLRIDALLRSGLGIARNKIETMFYENKIRLNGKPVHKKSDGVEEGDEIDIIREVNPNNPNLLTVARVEVLGVKPREEGYKVKVRRCKSLVVENYLQQ